MKFPWSDYQRGIRGFWRGICNYSGIRGTSETARSPGGMRGCRMSLRDYYRDTSVSYNMYKRIQEASLVMQRWY